MEARDRPLAQPWWTPIRKTLGHVRRRFGVETFDVFRRAVPDGLQVDVPEGYRFAWGTSQDISGANKHDTELDAHERDLGVARLGLGHRVVVGFHCDRPVFTMWANPRQLNVPGLLKRKLAPHQWFIYKAYTSPDHRGKKLYETGMRFVLFEMKKAGMSELIGYAHVKKRISRKGLARLAFESVGVVRQFRAPGWLWTRVSRDLQCYFPDSTPRSGILDGGEAATPEPETP